MFRYGCILAAVLALSPMGAFAETPAAETWLPSLQTETPQQGFELAIGMARRAVKTTQPDVEVLKAQRPVYSVDATSLIHVSGVAAAWFATIAAANGYWRE